MAVLGAAPGLWTAAGPDPAGADGCGAGVLEIRAVAKSGAAANVFGVGSGGVDRTLLRAATLGARTDSGGNLGPFPSTPADRRGTRFPGPAGCDGARGTVAGCVTADALGRGRRRYGGPVVSRGGGTGAFPGRNL